MTTEEVENLIRYYGTQLAGFRLAGNLGRVSLEKILERLAELAKELP